MLLLLCLPVAQATWSIIAVDAETEQVGIAGATCGRMVWGIAGLAPGHGVVAAQYDTFVRGRNDAVDLLMRDASPDEALDAALAGDEDASFRQWAIISLEGEPVGFTGGDVEQPAAIEAGHGWSVQGNTLASANVVTASAEAFQSSEGSLADRLVEALQAGAAEGGDHRCDPEDAAKSAFVYVASPGDRESEPGVEVRASGKGAVSELAERYAEGRGSCATGGSAGLLSACLAALAALTRRRRAPSHSFKLKSFDIIV